MSMNNDRLRWITRHDKVMVARRAISGNSGIFQFSGYFDITVGTMEFDQAITVTEIFCVESWYGAERLRIVNPYRESFLADLCVIVHGSASVQFTECALGERSEIFDFCLIVPVHGLIPLGGSVCRLSLLYLIQSILD